MKAFRKQAAVAVAATATVATLLVGAPSSSSAQAVPSLPAFGISSDGTIMAAFTTDRPGTLNWFMAVTGLSGDTALIGIDFRVQDGLLYGVGNRGGIYTISTPTTPTQDVVVTKVSQLTVPLYGTNFGVDFNPAADRLRVISDNGQNLRHDLASDTTTEDAVLTTPSDRATTRGVTAAAYTNNDRDDTTDATLYDLNTTLDREVIQSPANEGTLASVGRLGLDAGSNAGFDIYTDLSGGTSVSAQGFATIAPGGGSTASLYTVNIITGDVSPVGQFPFALTDIAVALDGS